MRAAKGKEALALAYIYRGFCKVLLPMCSLASLFRRPFARYADEDGEMTALLAHRRRKVEWKGIGGKGIWRKKEKNIGGPYNPFTSLWDYIGV